MSVIVLEQAPGQRPPSIAKLDKFRCEHISTIKCVNVSDGGRRAQRRPKVFDSAGGGTAAAVATRWGCVSVIGVQYTRTQPLLTHWRGQTQVSACILRALIVRCPQTHTHTYAPTHQRTKMLILCHTCVCTIAGACEPAVSSLKTCPHLCADTGDRAAGRFVCACVCGLGQRTAT